MRKRLVQEVCGIFYNDDRHGARVCGNIKGLKDPRQIIGEMAKALGYHDTEVVEYKVIIRKRKY